MHPMKISRANPYADDYSFDGCQAIGKVFRMLSVKIVYGIHGIFECKQQHRMEIT